MTSLDHATRRAFRPPFKKYQLDHAYDEMFEPSGVPRASYETLHERPGEMPAEELGRRQKAADLSFLHQGILVTVYGREEGTEKLFPYGVLPRIITSAEWTTIERGLIQRITALNLFLKDLYHEGKILKDRVIPREMIYTCRHYPREMRGVHVPREIYISILATELLRLEDARFAVLQENPPHTTAASCLLPHRHMLNRPLPQ